MIPIGEDVLTRLHNSTFLSWRTQITSMLRFVSKTRKGNSEIALFTIRSQNIYSRLQYGVLEHTNDSTGSGVNKPDNIYQGNEYLRYKYRG